MSTDIHTKRLEIKEIQSFANLYKLPVRDFGSREVISGDGGLDGAIGIVLSGCAYIAGVNENGRRSISDIFLAGDVFTQAEFPALSQSSYFYLASAGKCRAVTIEFSTLLKICSEEDSAAEKLLRYISLERGCISCTHTYILEQRALSEKLMLFFDWLSRRFGTDSYTLPISYTILADYLCADRSAMMRELRSLNISGRITTKNLSITLNRHRED